VIKVYNDSPAEKAGLQEEDILLKIDGKSLDEVDEMMDIISEAKIDDKITITYLREGKELVTDATITTSRRNVFVWEDKRNNPEHFVSGDKSAWLGVSTDKLSDQLRQFFNVPEYLGVLVKEVVEDSPAEKSGLKAGDVIIQVGKKEIEDTGDLMRAIDRFDAGEEVEVKIIREKKEKVIKIILGEEKGRFRHHFSFAPDIEIEIPEMDFEIPEIDLEELEKLDEKMRDEFEQQSDKLNEGMEELNRELKRIKIRTSQRKSSTI
jgi:C-terminal processing protease CtpA/Prc